MSRSALILLCVLVSPATGLAETKYVTAGEQFDGKFYSWPGFDDPREAEHMTTVTRQVVTPHISTAVPYSQGSTRVLFICPRFGARPTIELCQRFDIHERHALVARSSALTHLPREDFFGSPGDSLDEVAETLRQGLASRPEVVVVYKFAWRLLPEDVRQQVAGMVRSGTGLVFWDLEEGNALPRDLDQFAQDAEASAAILACAPEEVRRRFESLKTFASPDGGRVAALTCLPSDGLFSYLNDEDLYAVVGRVMLWAGKREPNARLHVSIDGDVLLTDVSETTPPGLTAEVAIYDLAAVLRHELEYEARIKPGEDLLLPHLKDGPHWVRVTLRNGKKVVDWTTRYVNITAPVAIEAIDLEQEHIQQGGTISAKVRISGEDLDTYVLAYRLVDTYDRVIGRGRTKASPETTIDAAVRDCLSPVCFLVVSLEREGRTIVEKGNWFTVAQPNVDAEDFHATLWPQVGAPNSSIWETSLRVQGKRMGIDFVLGGGEPRSDTKWPESILNLRPWVYAINHGNVPSQTEADGGPARSPCLTSAEYNKASDDTLTQRAQNTSRFSPVVYTDCGDARLHREGTDVCFSDTCLSDFREYLKHRYGSLEELNANWEADYQDWSEVMPVTLAELEAWKTDPAKPKPSPGQYARWVEHRMHMESVWADRHLRDKQAVQAVDPDAMVGLDALCDYGGSYGGFDFAKMLDFMGVLGPYANSFTINVSRSLARPGTILGCWVGGGYPHYRTKQYGSVTAWWLLFSRFNMQLLFVDYGPTGGGDLCPMFGPDLRPLEVTAEQMKELEEIQSGAGKLLLSARRENDGVAFLYSPASTHAATLTRSMPHAEFAPQPGVDGSPCVFTSEWLEYVTANEAMARIFTDLGLQYDYVTSEQVVGGRLSRDGFRVLVLPYAQALSAEVAAAIRGFAAAGGVVVADLRPGIFDGHGRPLERGQLDDMFGIERIGGGRLPEPLTMRALTDGSIRLPDMPVDHQVKVGLATALATADGGSALISHTVDKGKTILFNFYPGRYIALRTKGEEGPLPRSIDRLLASAGIEPQVTLESDGAGAPVTQVVRFSHGANEYVGVLREHSLFFSSPVPIMNQAPCRAIVDFGRKAHVYDARAGRYLGETRKVETTIAPAEAQLYALLPYRVTDIEVSEGASNSARSRDFDLRVIAGDGAKSGTHVLHIKVEDADGRERDEYQKNTRLDRGAATFRIPLALSDPKGEWLLTIRDAATGVVKQTSFR